MRFFQRTHFFPCSKRRLAANRNEQEEAGMYVGQSGPDVEVWAPAKLNLLLEVLSKRHDGLHEIVTVMTAVSVFDTLYFAAISEGHVALVCNWASALWGQNVSESSGGHGNALGDLPEGADNIVTRAVQLLRDRAGIKSGARVRLVKRIPSAAGLGGASSDAAAALVAANVGWKLGWSRDRLLPLAAELGSDVPFFLGPGAAVCRGRGERIEPVLGLGKWHFVVVRPPEGLSTPEVYRRCQPGDRGADVQPLLKALRRGDRAAVGRLLVNRLEEAAEPLSPWIGRLRHEFRRTDCPGHQMSGSGSSYFGVCRHARHARRVAARLRGRNVGRVFLAKCVFTTGRGERE